MPQTESLVTASDGLPARSAGKWVADKNYYLERYLDIATRGVGRKWNGKLAYVDLFSGPGLNVVRGTNEEVEGSPFLALKSNFASYVFVDSPQIIEILKERLRRHPKNSLISFVPGDCNDVIGEVRKRSPSDHLTLAFVDPTGLQIQFRTIRRFVQDRRVDLLMTIQFGMGILMNLKQYLSSESNVLDSFLGDKSWRDDYAAGGTPTQVGQRIVDKYAKQLRSLGYTTVKDREIPVRTDQANLLLYFIVLASRHPRALDFWQKATDIQASGQRRLRF